MDLNDYKSAIEQLVADRKTKAELREFFLERAKLARTGKFESKLANFSFGSMFTYCVGVLSLLFTGSDVVQFIQPTVGISGILGTSILGGFGISHFIDKKSESGEKRMDIFDGKGNKYFVEQEVRSLIEKDKVVNRDKVVKDVMSILNSKVDAIRTLDGEFNVILESDDCTEEELLERIETTAEKLDEAYRELDGASVRYTLSRCFADISDGYHNWQVYFNHFSGGALIGTFASMMPMMVYSNYYGILSLSSDSALSFVQLFAPLFVGGAIGLGIAAKKTKDERFVFRKLNKKYFGDDQPDKANPECYEVAKRSLELAIDNAAGLYLQLLMADMKLENMVFRESSVGVNENNGEEVDMDCYSETMVNASSYWHDSDVQAAARQYVKRNNIQKGDN